MSTPLRPSQPSAQAFELRANIRGWQLKSTQPIKKGDPVVLGPQTKCSGGDYGWYSVRMERGWPDDFGIFHKGCGETMYDITMPHQPHGFPLVVGIGIQAMFNLPDDMVRYHLYLPDGRVMLDPDHESAPPLPWRANADGINSRPPSIMEVYSPWYFLDHDEDSNLKIGKYLYKIAKEDGTFHRAIVFEAARDIKHGEWLNFTYEEVNPDW